MRKEGALGDFDLGSVYQWCALVGGVLLVLQILLMFLGADSDVDVEIDADLDADGFFTFLSLKTIVAFVTFFGLVGMLMEAQSVPKTVGVIAATVAGSAAFYIVGLVMASLHRLESQGNLDLSNALGKMATVYLRVPAVGEGQGKVTVTLQSRTVEIAAVTDDPKEIGTGSQVVVTGVRGEVVEVTPMR